MQRSTFNRIKNIFGSDNLGIQDVYTPINKIEEVTCIKFFDFVTPETKNIGVLFNWEFVYTMLEEAAKNNYTNDMKFTYFYDSEADKKALEFTGFHKNRFAKVNYEIEFVNICEFTEKNKDIKVIKKAMAGKHFDIVFSNPPYNGNIDLKILQTVFSHADKAVFIHPSTFLLDKKFKTKIYNDVRNTNYLEKAIFIWGNEMFDILLFAPIVISVWNTHKETPKCDIVDTAFIKWTNNKSEYTCNINDISLHGDYFQKVKRFLNCEYNLHANITDENELTDYSVALPLIRGGNEYGKGNYSHFYSILGLDDNNYKCDSTFRLSESAKSHTSNGKNFPLFTFSSEAERENFLGYCKTKIVRFLLSLVKMNANMYSGELKVIPWMNFSQSWNDKKLCEEFGIDEELWQYIDKFIPDYYEDYESGFESKTIVSRHKAELPNDEIMKFCPKDVLDYIISAEITKDIFVSKSFRHIEGYENFNFQVFKYKTKTPGIYAWSLVKHVNKNF